MSTDTAQDTLDSTPAREEESRGSELTLEQVSKSFWLYWAVTLPLTFGVVAVWLIWTNREDVKRFLARKKHKPERKGSESALSTS